MRASGLQIIFFKLKKNFNEERKETEKEVIKWL